MTNAAHADKPNDCATGPGFEVCQIVGEAPKADALVIRYTGKLLTRNTGAQLEAYVKLNDADLGRGKYVPMVVKDGVGEARVTHAAYPGIFANARNGALHIKVWNLELAFHRGQDPNKDWDNLGPMKNYTALIAPAGHVCGVVKGNIAEGTHVFEGRVVSQDDHQTYQFRFDGPVKNGEPYCVNGLVDPENAFTFVKVTSLDYLGR
jgi:hypothetical protein